MSRKFKVRKCNIVDPVPQPAGSIDLYTFIKMQRRAPSTEFCTCEEALGEHLRMVVEAEDGRAVIHYFPGRDGITVLRLET